MRGGGYWALMTTTEHAPAAHVLVERIAGVEQLDSPPR